MTKFSVLGILSCVAGGLVIGFQFLSSIIGKAASWESLAIADIVNEKYISWIQGLSMGGLESIPDAIVHMPIFIVLFCLGGFFFVLEYFFGRR